jgi:hypothetical protein
MRKLLFVVAAAALATPLLALAADPPSSDGASPAQACAAERAAIGASAFRDLYGMNTNKSNAFGKCVAKRAQAREQNHQNAVDQCRADQSDANFAAGHDGKTFDQFYGTGKGKNAFGKCVSGKATAENQSDDAATVKAAKQCKRERASDAAAFKAKYGTNRNKSNAFGKCVSQKAKPA